MVGVRKSCTIMKKILYMILLLGITVQAQMVGIVSAGQVSGICDPHPLEVYPSNNAASPGFCEDNAVGPWTYTSNNTISTSTDSYDGTYSLVVENTVGAVSTRREFDFTGEDGAMYVIKIWAKKNTASNAGFVAWTGFTGFANQYVTTSWAEYTFTLVASGTAQKIRAYPSTDSGTALAGDKIFIDNITIIKQSDVWWQDNAASLADVNSLGTHYTLHQGPTYTVDATDFHDGAYSLKQVCNNDALSQAVQYSFPVISGQTYALNFWYKSFIDPGATRQPRLYQKTNCTITTNGLQLTSTSWVEVSSQTITATATGNAVIEFMSAPAAGDLNNTLWLDKVTIIRN